MSGNNLLQKGQHRWLWLTALILLSDQMTKHLIIHTLHYREIWPILPGLNLTLLFNYGAAFSFLNLPESLWPKIIFASAAIITVLVIFYWLYRLSRDENALAGGLSLIAGGALGNLYDRLSLGYVIDFIDVYAGSYHWPAFNVADMAICTGAFIVLIRLFQAK